MNFSSKLIENSVEAFASLPGIGRKTALRLTLHLVGKGLKETEEFTAPILNMRQQIQHCSVCHNLSDDAICNVCSDKRRDRSLVCVVESIRDVMAVEDTRQYRGLYHVLGGLINPLDGIKKHAQPAIKRNNETSKARETFRQTVFVLEVNWS